MRKDHNHQLHCSVGECYDIELGTTISLRIQHIKS